MEQVEVFRQRFRDEFIGPGYSGKIYLYFPDTHFIYHIPSLKFLRRLHFQHHDIKEMDKYNFNITYPVFDVVFGTLKIK